MTVIIETTSAASVDCRIIVAVIEIEISMPCTNTQSTHHAQSISRYVGPQR